MDSSVFNLFNSVYHHLSMASQLYFPTKTKIYANENFQSRCPLSRSENHSGPWDLEWPTASIPRDLGNETEGEREF